jgi:hypothetical protein
MPRGIFPPSDPGGQVSLHRAPRLTDRAESTRLFASQLTNAVCIAGTHLTSAGVHSLSSAVGPSGPCLKSALLRGAQQALIHQVMLSLFLFSACGLGFLRHRLSTVHCSFLAVGLLTREPVGLTTFRILEVRMGWVLSIRRSRGCLRIDAGEVYHPIWLKVVVLVSHPSTSPDNDAYESSLAFTRTSFPWPAWV